MLSCEGAIVPAKPSSTPPGYWEQSAACAEDAAPSHTTRVSSRALRVLPTALAVIRSRTILCARSITEGRAHGQWRTGQPGGADLDSGSPAVIGPSPEDR